MFSDIPAKLNQAVVQDQVELGHLGGKKGQWAANKELIVLNFYQTEKEP